jgi:hypothetical protein
MAPVTLPPEQTETFTLTGTGVLLLTLEQRTSRRLSITVEKVFVGPLLSYYNFRIPEPATFWGYLQTVNRDSIIETFELKYRRESIIRWDTYELEPIEQLRCLIKESTLLLFDTATNFYISQGADGAALGQDRANYLLNVNQPRLIPSNPITGIYYEIEGNHLCQITLIWQDYAEPCVNPAGKQNLPSPRSPGGGESGSNSSGGGGTRPAIPPPGNRSSDPDSDSPAPPPDSPSGPPSPSPGPGGPLPIGPYRVTVEVVAFQSGSAPCVEIAGPRPTLVYDVDPGPATVNKDLQPGGQGYVWRLVDNNGARIANISGSSIFNDCDSIVNITSQVYLGP